MTLQRYFIKLSYKGTHFFGWQIQPNAITVQEKINIALTKLNRGVPISVTGCGRTDTGVHASEFYAHFEANLALSTADLAFKLNTMLPADIAVQKVFEVPQDLHSRFSATSRTYHYFIHTRKNPFLAEHSWLIKKELQLDQMQQACERLIGKQNFKCFSKNITGDSSFECNVTEAYWETTDEGLKFTISANRFLRNMVRAIVGTMVEIGQAKKTIDDLEQIIASKDRQLAGQSAPAQGLFLARVHYKNDQHLFS